MQKLMRIKTAYRFVRCNFYGCPIGKTGRKEKTMILEHNQMRIDFCKENLESHCCETTRKCDGLCNNCFLEVVPQFIQYCKATERRMNMKKLVGTVTREKEIFIKGKTKCYDM